MELHEKIIFTIIISLVIIGFLMAFMESERLGWRIFHVIMISLLSFLIYAGCSSVPRKPKHFTGYVVYKLHDPEHMCCDKYKPVTESAVVIVPHTAHVHHHVKVQSTWKIWVANKNETHIIHVSESTWNNHKCGDKIKVTI